MKKQVLIVTYYWPPAGGPGVQRWLKFVKYLPQFNIEPVVYCPSNPNYPLIDDSLVNEISNTVKVIKQPIIEPYRLAQIFSKKTKTISKGVITEKNSQSLTEKLLLFVRGNFFIPDARKNWIKPSVSFLSHYLVENNIDTVITTGPPHSMHLIGCQLKSKLNIKWVADFRDPWTSIGYHKQLKLMSWAKKKHKKLERLVLNTADSIMVTSWQTKEEFGRLTKKPIAVITNGFDEEERNEVTLDTKFTLSHIGSLLSKRNPEILWNVLSELVKENEEVAKSLELNFVGFINENVLQSIKKYNLSDYINNIGYVNHNEAVEFQKKSQVLLLIEIDSEETKGIIPGKLFEYLCAKRPILALGPEASDISKILLETNAGHYFNYQNSQALKKQILRYFHDFKSQDLNTKSHPESIAKYHRKALTKSLASLITNKALN